VTRIHDPWSESAGLDDRPRRKSRVQQLRATTQARRRFLKYTALGTLIPGVGLIAAGRRRSGWTILTALFIVTVVAIAYLVQGGQSRLLSLGLDSSVLRFVGYGFAVLALFWLVIALISRRALEPPNAGVGARLLSAVLVIVVGSAVITPMLVMSRYAFSSRTLVDRVFPGFANLPSLTKPTDASEANPWAGKPRVNVLLLGSDAGPAREGIRPDSIILASIDTQTGATTLFQLPRNLSRVPFPDLPGPAGELHRRYPNGFTGGGRDGESIINAVYRNAPAANPEIFAGMPDPGAEATKLAVMGALGVDVDYYVMVNLAGFEAVINALGGIDVNVPYRIPMGATSRPSGGCSQPFGWIEPGSNRHLDGQQALWFARARCGPGIPNDDYERVRRQRCVIQAVAEAADPLTLITKYTQITSAARDMITTDIPQTLLPAFAQLGLKVKRQEMRSVAFTNEVINPANPDYAYMHAIVQNALTPAPASAAPTTGAPAAPTTPAQPATPDPNAPPKISSDTGQPQPLSSLCD
jgi:LCP family protein required for cell wall assembly